MSIPGRNVDGPSHGGAGTGEQGGDVSYEGERAGESAGESAGEQAGERAGERAGEGAGESAGEQAGERGDDASGAEREDAQLVSMARAISDAERLLRRARSSVLSTLSKKMNGWPFGSIAPYAMSACGEPILFISTIAEHTKNIDADSRVSLLVQEQAPDGDGQAHGRLTLLGNATTVRSEDVADVRARYLARVPSAESYAETHDFSFYRVSLEHIRYIGGFGQIFWLEPSKLRLDPARDPLAGGSSRIITHMNEDHADALVLYCRAFKGVTPESATMVGVDQWGFDVECASPSVRLRFDFEEPVTMETIRPVVVAMVKHARALLGVAASM